VLPGVAGRHGLAPGRPAVLFVEAGPTILAGSSPQLPPLAQVALEEGETVARNLDAELNGRPLEAFTFHDKGFVVSVGTSRGVADIAGITTGGHLAHLLKTPSSGSTASPSSTCAAGTQ
jgi:hypothetical protein